MPLEKFAAWFFQRLGQVRQLVQVMGDLLKLESKSKIFFIQIFFFCLKNSETPGAKIPWSKFSARWIYPQRTFVLTATQDPSCDSCPPPPPPNKKTFLDAPDDFLPKKIPTPFSYLLNVWNVGSPNHKMKVQPNITANGQ